MVETGTTNKKLKSSLLEVYKKWVLGQKLDN